LLYPSYGDTYPSFNGAIGMTYEQGGIGAGLAVELNNGDTLTLKQRISHHVATSFAALAAIADNADKNVAEFVKYFEKSRNNPEGQYQTFVLKSKEAETKIEELTHHLDLLGIKYGQAGKQYLASGYSYQENKIKGFSIDANDLVLSMNQPKSKLLKVLFEPKTMVEDSVTYDITAWSLPLAYGIKAYALKEKVTSKAFELKKITNEQNFQTKPYAFILKWNSFTDTKVLAELLAKKLKIRQAELPFEIDGKAFDRGSLIVARTSNEVFKENLPKLIYETANKYNVPVTPIYTGMATKGFDLGSGTVNFLKAPKVAIVGGEGTNANAFGEVWHYFDKQIAYPSTVVNMDILGNGNFTKFDLLILPDGNYNRYNYESALKSLSDWVRMGGRLILMEDANLAFADKAGFELKRKEAKKDTSVNLKVFEDREREAISEETPGSIYSVDMDNSHPLAFGYEKTYASLVLKATDFSYLKTGWNVGTIRSNNLISGFSGKKAQEKLKNSLVFGVEELGKGKIVYIINNPLFRGFWQNGKLLFANAVLGMGN
jgi:hypothetical protein